MDKIIEVLGLSWQSMIVYFFNFLLVAALAIFLIYKPLRKVIDARQNMVRRVLDENNRMNEETQSMKREYDGKLHDIKQEVAHIVDETTRKAEAKSHEIIEAAKLEASEIVMSSRHEMEEERERLRSEYFETVSEMSLSIASKILEREISETDNKKIIDEALEKWAE